MRNARQARRLHNARLLAAGAGLALGGGGGCTPVDQTDGNVGNGATFMHPADGVVAWTMTTVGSGVLVDIRRVSAGNRWIVTINSTGALILQERVSGSSTTRAAAAGVVSNGSRVAIVMDGNTFTGYVNQVEVWSYASGGNFATQTNGAVTLLTSAVLSDLKTWTLACRAQEGV